MFYIFKNAIKNITRTKARNILIGIIVVVIATVSCIALSIKNSATKLISSYKDSYQIEAKLTLDREKLRSNAKTEMEKSDTKPQDFMSNVPEITVDNIKNYGDSSYVKSYYYTIETQINSSSIEKVSDKPEDDENTSNNIMQMGNRPDKMSEEGSSRVNGDFSIIGYSSQDAMTNFVSGEYKITSGEMFDIADTNNPCVISNELAEANELEVGSNITLVNPNDESKTYTFVVKGIYGDSSESNEFSMFSGASNQILTNYESLKKVVADSNSSDTTKFEVTTEVYSF